MSNVTLKHTHSQKPGTTITARSFSLRCVLAAEHHTAEQYSKTGRTKQRKHFSRSDLSLNTLKDFLKIPSLREAALETERRCFSKVILESNVTANLPTGTILLTPYTMVWDWRVSRSGPVLFYWPMLPYPYFSLLINGSLSLLSIYRLVLSGWGFRNDTVYITISQPCTADLF